MLPESETETEIEINPEGESEPIREAARRTDEILVDLAEVDEMHRDVETFVGSTDRRRPRSWIHKIAIVTFAAIGIPAALVMVLGFLANVLKITGIPPFVWLWVPWHEGGLIDWKFTLSLWSFIIVAFFLGIARIDVRKRTRRAPQTRRSPFSRVE